MSKQSNKQTDKQPATWRAYMNGDWFAGFMSEVQHSSITAVAAKLGIERTTISQVFNGSGEYGKGTSSTGNIERAYRGHYEKLSCPHTQAQVGINHCRELALRAAPTHNPLQMQQWQACQQCRYKPAEKITAACAIRPDVDTLTVKVPQQAGIIDTVTLPPPEVGGPQISKGDIV